MMNITDAFPVYPLLVSNALLLAAATLAILKFQRLLKSSSEFWDSPNGSTLQAQNDQGLINRQTDERLALLQDALDSIKRSEVKNLPAPAEKLPFENAVRMAKAGASLDDLVRTCGLSKSEARLFMRIHAKSAA
jgi:hypothetical protein